MESMAAKESLQLKEGQVDNKFSVANSTELTNCGKRLALYIQMSQGEISFAIFDKPHRH